MADNHRNMTGLSDIDYGNRRQTWVSLSADKSREEVTRAEKNRQEMFLLVTRSFLVIHSSLLFKRICFLMLFIS